LSLQGHALQQNFERTHRCRKKASYGHRAPLNQQISSLHTQVSSCGKVKPLQRQAFCILGELGGGVKGKSKNGLGKHENSSGKSDKNEGSSNFSKKIDA